jgi:hypothetical protein
MQTERTDDWAKAIDVNKEMIAKDFIILTKNLLKERTSVYCRRRRRGEFKENEEGALRGR